MTANPMSMTVSVQCDDDALLVTLADDTDLPTRDAIRSLSGNLVQLSAHVLALRCPNGANALRFVVTSNPSLQEGRVLGEAEVQVTDQPVRVTSAFGQRFSGALLSPRGAWMVASSWNETSDVPWQLCLWPLGSGPVSAVPVGALYGVAPMTDAPF